MKFLKNNIIEILAVLGCFFIVFASFLINLVLGFYILGAILVLFSAFLCIPKKKGVK